ncbi:CotH kinase family protein [Paenibacillus piri]|uniref:Spore coat protein CotH n=1 Tax=Paenibacillus piri TaxID=2547395 RepID=A0A4R5KS85_9BACL|nr:CotH kinase family protein [Paenibacillus piri]TDF97677.1 spore coat protein CotH [Paenibacillus piri]
MPLITRNIVIGRKQLEQLEKNVWSEDYVRAYMLVHGKKQPVRLRYRGGHTREYPQKSYEIVRKGKIYHYNAEADDPSMIRNALSFRFFRNIGVPSPKTKHCLLTLNGQSLGVYLEIEGVDKLFFQKRGIAVRSLFYAGNDYANFSLTKPGTQIRKKSLFSGYERIIGGKKEVEQWKSFILKLNSLSGRQLLQYLKLKLDIANYLHWLAGAVLTGNYDGFDQNYAVYRHKTKLTYRMIPWDYEGTWGRNCYGKKVESDLVKVTGYNVLTRKLLAYPAIRKQYKKLLVQLLNRHFTVRQLDPLVRRMTGNIATYIHKDGNRKWSRAEFDGEPAVIRAYIKERRKRVKAALQDL